MRTKLFSLFSALCLSAQLFAFKVDGISYSIIGGDSVEVTTLGLPHEDGYTGAITIPATVDYNAQTYRVTAIGQGAFYNCTVTSVTIPNSVTTIDRTAFKSSSLASITIPENITTIAEDAFNDCSNLTIVNWNAKHCIKCSAYIFARSPITTFTFGANVDIIPGYVCCGLDKLVSVTINDGVKVIGREAFGNCRALTSITIPETVTTIDARAFAYSGLTTVNLPNSVTDVSREAFSGCPITTPIYNDHVFAFMPDSYTGEYCIPEGIKTIASYAFYDCKNLTSLVIPQSVITIGFRACPRYSQNPNIHSFKCYSTQLDSENAKNCQTILYSLNLDTIIAPAGAFDIDEDSWSSLAKSIKYVHVNSGELTSNAFAVINRSAKALSTLDLTAISNKEIPDEAFMGYYKLETLRLPAQVEYVGYNAFEECKRLKSIEFPASVLQMYDNAFASCTNLQEITCLATVPPTIEAKTFYEVNRSIPLYVPAESVGAYKAADYWKEFTKIQAINCPDGIENIYPTNSTQIYKIMQNGTIYILRNGEKYTIDGRLM